MAPVQTLSRPSSRSTPSASASANTRRGSWQRAPSVAEAQTVDGALARGMRGQSVSQLQNALNQQGARLDVDGKFGPQTESAVRQYQQANGLKVDGLAGRETLGALQRSERSRDAFDGTQAGAAPRAPTEADRSARPAGSVPAADLQRPMNAVGPRAKPGAPANRTATFDSVQRAGARNQMATGRITVNGNTYDFRTGGHGRGSLPKGDYKITPHLYNRSDRSMSVGGVGYSFAMSDKYDARVGDTRSLLRIHPDGGSAGTMGCIGIVGDRATQQRFREDMRQELMRNGGSFNLRVG